MQRISLHRYGIYGGIYLAWLLMLFSVTLGWDNPAGWFVRWDKWDAIWYAQIWKIGYPQLDPRTLVYPPGYPMLIGAMASVFSAPFHVTALVVNCCAFFAATVLAAELVSRLILKGFHISFFIFALTSPTAYFIFPAYSDAVFMLCIWAALFLALMYPLSRRARIAEAAILVLAPWIRVTGYSLLSWVLLRRYGALWIGVSLCLWLGMNLKIAGDPFYFIDAMHMYNMPRGGFMTGLRAASIGVINFITKDSPTFTWLNFLTFYFLPLLYFVLLVMVGIWMFLYKQPLIAVTIFSILAISHHRAFWLSEMRYDLPIMLCIGVPLFVWAGRCKGRLSKRAVYGIIILVGLCQLALQITYAREFKFGRWAF